MICLSMCVYVMPQKYNSVDWVIVIAALEQWHKHICIARRKPVGILVMLVMSRND